MRTKYLFFITMLFLACEFHVIAQETYYSADANSIKQKVIARDGTYINYEQTGFEKNPDKNNLGLAKNMEHNTYTSQKDRVVHNLTIRFEEYNDPYQVGAVIVQNDQIFYDRSDLSAGQILMGSENNMAFARISDIAEGEYHIMLDNVYEYYWGSFGLNSDTIVRVVFLNLNINRDIDTTINLSALAEHKVEIITTDEFGEVIPYESVDNLSKVSMLNLGFTGLAMQYRSFILYPKVHVNNASISKNYFMMSDMDQAFNLICTGCYLKQGKLYMADCEEQSGCTGDIILTNDASEYKAMEWIFGSRPESVNEVKYLTVEFAQYCNREVFSTCIRMGTGMNGSYPINEGENFVCFLSNKQRNNNQTKGRITYWEGMPSSIGGNNNYIEFPFFLTSQDSIIFVDHMDLVRNYNYKLLANDPMNPVKFNPIGQETLFFATTTSNNYSSPLTIDPIFHTSGQMRNFNYENAYMTPYERSRSTFELKHGENLLLDGKVKNFPDIYYCSEGGDYSLIVKSLDYLINYVIQGELTNKLDFNISNFDPDAPVLGGFRIENIKGELSCNNTFLQNSVGTLIFNAFDWDASMGQPIKLQNENIHFYYKKYEESEWINLQIIERPDLSDYNWWNEPNYYYSSDLSVAISGSAYEYIDLKIELSDESGNMNTQEWHPAYFVDGSIALAENESDQFLVYPNPANGELHLIIPTGIEGVKMYNHIGQLVRSSQSIHEQHVLWDTRSLNGGTYFLRFIGANGKIFNKKVIII